MIESNASIILADKLVLTGLDATFKKVDKKVGFTSLAIRDNLGILIDIAALQIFKILQRRPKISKPAVLSSERCSVLAEVS